MAGIHTMCLRCLGGSHCGDLRDARNADRTDKIKLSARISNPSIRVARIGGGGVEVDKIERSGEVEAVDTLFDSGPALSYQLELVRDVTCVIWFGLSRFQPLSVNKKTSNIRGSEIRQCQNVDAFLSKI